MNKMKAKLSKFEMFTFASGDIFGGGAQIIISFYYLIFLTDVIKIRPALAGTIILISKIWDGISDPLMGVITDNTRTRWGRRKPYFLAGFFGIIIAFFLLWYPVGFESQTLRFIYVLVTYLFFSTISTMVMVPYAAMSSEISTDYRERTVVNGTRLFFSQFSSLLCAVLPLEIVKICGSEKTGYIAMGIIFAVFFAIPYFLIFFFTKERVPISNEKSDFSIKLFFQPFKIKTFRRLIGIYLFAFLAMDVVSTVFAYYMNYMLNRPNELNYVLGAMLITQIILVVVIIKLATKIGKAKTVMLSTLIWGIAIILLGLVQPTWPSWVIYAVAVVMGCGIIGCVVMPWTMYPDVTDVGELAFGKRSSGSFGGIMTFMRKFSSAVGIFIVSQILDLAGYIKPLEIEGQKILQTQPDSVVLALKVIVIIVPFVLLFGVFFLAKKYPLSESVHNQLSNYLEFKRGNTETTDLKKEEVEELKDLLI